MVTILQLSQLVKKLPKLLSSNKLYRLTFLLSSLPSIEQICIYIYIYGCVCFKIQKMQGNSISTCTCQQANLPQVQRSSVNHQAQFLCTKTNTYTYMHPSVCIQKNGAKKEHQSNYLSTSELT